tara:strand:+ start:1863 stop:2141 length:279 start_codon:yes stop_codon:yes gene_type:complete
MKAKAKYNFEIVTATMPPKRNNTNSKYMLHQLSQGNAYRIPADHESVQRNSRGNCLMLSAVGNYNRRHYKYSDVKIRTRRYANDDLWVGVTK